MINLNKDLFFLILFIMIFIGAILKIIIGIVCHGEEKTYGLGDTADGILWLILCIIILVT